MSCCFLAVDFLYNKNDQSLPTQLLVSDIISSVMGFFFCLLGFLGKKENEDTLLQEPLLNGTSTRNATQSNKSSGGEIVAPFPIASLLSKLTFSWMGPLIGAGYRKTLDLDDVPQLAGIDCVQGAFPIFRSKLEFDSGSGSRITTCKLVKALLFVTRWEILLTSFLSLVGTLASYVGPYLIDSFVQYLNGNRALKNQGYVLVSTFFVAKLIECLAQRHWALGVQQAGIRARGVLVATIYNEGLSILCQSKQDKTSGEIINFMSVDAQRVGDFVWYMHDVWLVMVQVGLALVILYKNLGLASIAALVVTVVVMLANVPKEKNANVPMLFFVPTRAPMLFFDSTPSGRILNRACTDQSLVDLNMPYAVGACAFSMIQLLGIIVVMSMVAWQQFYIPSARELARLGGVCKAPVIQHFAETMSGSTTIRSFDQESRFKELNMKSIDGHSRPNFYTAGAMEWLCFRLDMLSSIIFAFSLVFLISIPKGKIDPSIAGLAVMYGLNLNMFQAEVIWKLCNMENKIISVERILQYAAMPSEPPLVIEENRPDGALPSQGDVIQDLQIDGINISSIGLHDLRSRLSIIPPDPTMFEGTVRSNLDPLEEYTDEHIWKALDKCQLGDEARKKEGKLDSAVTENGENWSMGQRQLVCLGRVLLKKNKVLVLDEATASMDTATDNLIQQTLKHHFSDCTVLTIAHRITSVVDSDMVLLLDNGLIDEYDSPTKLLQNKSSSFSKLVAEYSTRSSSSVEK
ncbi:hypothetical protein Vadar_016532 [Vaccinium darrowii]|uniref:Uncharacterized protein n=1 Tax=Vaccinium darrowii TaxID=229202 RepID=A0ACB7Z419_9ERIC|nr:hypothetical protein Vadar_016532 [Vaccinium darrowii]